MFERVCRVGFVFAFLGALGVPSLATSTPLGAQPGVRSASEQHTPAARTTAFYRWYLGELKAEREPSDDAPAKLAGYLTAALRTTLAQQRKAGTLTSDYFLKAQDWLTTWPDSVNVRLLSQTSRNAVVQVTLGALSERRQLTVALLRERGNWQVNSVRLVAGSP